MKSKNSESFYITQSYTNANGKSTSKTIRKLGTLAELSAQLHTDRDGVVEGANEQARLETLKYKSRHKFEYDLNAILSDLIYTRVLEPSSKSSSFRAAKQFLEPPTYELHDVYRALSVLASEMDFIQSEVYKNSFFLGDRMDRILYYDCTNYFFEIEQEDGDKKYGKGKEHRPNPIVQMGLFMDNQGIPITYELFPGNTNDCLTYRPNFGRIKKQFDLGRVISVADKGMTTGDNIWYTINTPTHDGYVFSMSIRGAEKSIKDYVLEQEGYEWLGTEYKRKSRKSPRTIQVSSVSGKKIKKQVNEKQVVFWSEKYAKRAKAEREAALTKARDLAKNPGNYTRATSYGAAKYVKK